MSDPKINTSMLFAKGGQKALFAWLRLTSMTDHRGDGIPTQYCWPDEVRAAANDLAQAIITPSPPTASEITDRLVQAMKVIDQDPTGNRTERIWIAMANFMAELDMIL